MKKVFLLIFTSFCFMSFSLITNAACNDEELNKWADEAVINFIEETGGLVVDNIDDKITVGDIGDTDRKYAYVLLITPDTDKVKAVVTNNLDDEKKTFKYDEDYSTLAIGSYIHFDTKKYTITLYGDENSACPGEKLKVLSYSVPSYNMYQLTDFCDKNPGEDICRIEKDTTDITPEEFEEIIEEQEENIKIEKMSFFEKIAYYVAKYWYYVIIPIVAISLFYIFKIVSYKKKVDKE